MENFLNGTPPPVLLIVFNRPHKAMQVFEKIRQVRPPKMFIVADGSRPNRPGEIEKVQQCRAIKDLVDWDCDLKVNFAETNMGCRDRIASGITWAFEHVDELIILEDDCVPDLTFFRFCQELLEKYRDDNRIFSIGGYSYDHCEPFEESYAFSKIFECWGWATWKRAWNYFDITMSQWSALKQDKYWKNIFGEQDRTNLKNEFQLTYEGKINSWGYIFYINSLANHALHIIPKVNLVRNTGFELGGTHTGCPSIYHLCMDEAIKFPLVHPDIISPLNRLSAPPIITENTPENINKLNQIFTEYDDAFKQLLQLKRYDDVIAFFKDKVLRNRNLSYGHPLTPYHVNYAYYVAVAYFNLGDYEHAEAMLDIVLTVLPKNIDALLFMIQIHLVQQNFDKVQHFIDELSQTDVNSFTKEQTATLNRFLEALNSIGA